jgi:glyoxylate utilization-related uncharacterized protein
MSIFAVVEGALRVKAGGETAVLSAGGFCLVPASCGEALAEAEGGAAFLQVQLG